MFLVNALYYQPFFRLPAEGFFIAIIFESDTYYVLSNMNVYRMSLTNSIFPTNVP